jgi:hypothetical protein
MANHSEASRQKVVDDVAEHGWMCVHLRAEGHEGPYSYTVGLFRTYSHPELAVFGLSGEVAHQVLNNAVALIQQGHALDPSQPVSGLVEDCSCLLASVPVMELQRYFGICRSYYEGDRFAMLQIIWPTRQGQFPWDASSTAGFRAMQPIVGHLAWG